MTIVPHKIPSLEFVRLLSMIAIVAIHSGLLMEFPLINEQPLLGNIVNQISRFAVPFFFIVSGFLIYPKLIATPISTAQRYCLPLFRVWFIWSIICLLLPMNLATVLAKGYWAERIGYWNWLSQNLLNSLLEGGLVHLWFLPALIIAVFIIAILLHFKLRKLIMPISVALYLYGVLAGSYTSITDLTAPFFTRNGPFFATLLVAIGFEIRRKEFKLSAFSAAIIMCIGMFGHLIEAYWLSNHGVNFNSHDFLFFTPLWGVGLVMFLLAKPNLGNNRLVHYLNVSILGIYVSHLSIIIILSNISREFALTGLPKDIFVFIGTLIVTVMFVKSIEKTPLNKYLFR